ncbi:MAG: lactate racemase domain-containing protein [Deltaproteobacteria bacterium]|nr:lactate racemase domain-containing protein [Deltaproteobacteria bacterium]
MFPMLYKVKQILVESFEPDPSGAVRREIGRCDLSGRFTPGQTIAVAVGSRGIQGIVGMVAAMVSSLKMMGLRPFIIPAMGSHGGATSDGQQQVLEHMGITEAAVGAPIRSSMDVVSLGHLPSGAEVFVARDAMEADHLALINRVKPHTAFRGQVESGICKMLTVGCGKHQGASNMHKFGLAESIVPAARVILDRVSVLFGIAVLENAAEKTHTVRLVLPETFIESDTEMLKTAFGLFPRIPVDDLDILVVGEMGKNISGGGMDPNVIGMWRRDGGARQPNYRTLVLLDLTPESHGNAMGIGLADLTTRRVIDMLDIKATYTNALTTGLWAAARLPISLENDRIALEMALSRVCDLRKVRMACITNTLFLETFWASPALLTELRLRGDIEIDENPLAFRFSSEGRLLPFSAAGHEPD